MNKKKSENTQVKIALAKQAFARYEEAVKAAHDALGDGGLVHGLGSTVMKQVSEWSDWRNDRQRFECAECGSIDEGRAESWKFCRHCGAEIIRWETKKPSNFITVTVSSKTPKPKQETFNIEIEKPKRRAGTNGRSLRGRDGD